MPLLHDVWEDWSLESGNNNTKIATVTHTGTAFSLEVKVIKRRTKTIKELIKLPIVVLLSKIALTLVHDQSNRSWPNQKQERKKEYAGRLKSNIDEF